MQTFPNTSPVVAVTTLDETIDALRETESQTIQQQLQAQLGRFLDLAKQGNRRGCSGGERRSHLLAKAIAEHAPGLDGNAVEGLIHFVRLAAARPSTARDLIA